MKLSHGPLHFSAWHAMPKKAARNNKSVYRPFLLLEVLIASFLLMLALVPLISPSAAILKQQKLITDKIELDHIANLFYGDFLTKLYSGAYSFADLGIENENGEAKKAEPRPLNFDDLYRLGYKGKIPYSGTYSLRKIIAKPSKQDVAYRIYQIELTLVFTPDPPAFSITGKSVGPSLFTYVFCAVKMNADKESSPPKESAEKPAPSEEKASK